MFSQSGIHPRYLNECWRCRTSLCGCGKLLCDHFDPDEVGLCERCKDELRKVSVGG